ncbi:cardiolipin synthase [Paenibacillus sp. YYML68]|uniref:cardiolipin synthase n=1 Tax=Paenibacillus sp. YYML68 TaxID=2909250 RepID=UPI0024923825|nr:cardiolipin synthase [Paenibacillus sp. YYML68]
MELLREGYSLISIINIFLAMTVIFMERRNVGVTWAWVMVLFFLPGVGFILYLIFGQNLARRKLYRLPVVNRQLVDTLVEQQKEALRLERIPFRDEAAKQSREMILMHLNSAYAIYTQDNEVAIFTEGNRKFQSLLHDIKAAKDHVHLMYFIIRDDALGQRLMETLAAKAREGVQVKLLYDAIGCQALPRTFFQSLREAGGEAAAFFPSRIPYINLRVNYRNHRKLAIIDGRIGYIGGFNVGNEYLGLSARFGHWRDTHLRLTGGAVLHMQALFFLDWELAAGEQPEVEPRYFPIQPHPGQVGLQIVASGPDSEWQQIKNGYIKMIVSARESVYIQTPYFIPDESLITALKMAAVSGVDVKIMIPYRPDHKLVYWASFSYIGDLLSCGVQCYLYDKGFLHAKMIVCDGKTASVGTANVDIRSFKLNFEVNAFIYDTRTALQLKDAFERDMLDSRWLTLAAYNRRPLLHKFREPVARLLSPIL